MHLLPIPACPVRALRLLLLAWACSCAGALGAAELLVVASEPAQTGGDAEFIEQLRLLHAQGAQAGERVRLLRAQDVASARRHLARPPGDTALAGVRTRSVPPAQPAPAHADPVVIALGAQAARAMLESADAATPVLALLSRAEFDSLGGLAAWRRPGRAVAVLLREADVALQLALAELVLPGLGTLAVVATSDLEPLVQELLSAAPQADIAVAYASAATALGEALREVLPQADALLLLSDQLGGDANAARTLLHAAASAGKPVFGSSEASVRAGALAAAAPTQAQLAQQALALSNRLLEGIAQSADPPPLVETAYPVRVHTNAVVADRLGLVLAPPAVLEQRLHAIH